MSFLQTLVMISMPIFTFIITLYYLPENLDNSLELTAAQISPLVPEVLLEHNYALKSKLCLPRHLEEFSAVSTFTSFENRCCINDTVKLLPENDSFRAHYAYYQSCFNDVCYLFRQLQPFVSKIVLTEEKIILLKNVYAKCFSMIFEPYLSNMHNLESLWLWSHHGIGQSMGFNRLNNVTQDCRWVYKSFIYLMETLPIDPDFYLMDAVGINPDFCPITTILFLAAQDDYRSLCLFTENAKQIILAFQNLHRVLENLDIEFYNFNICFLEYRAKIYRFLH